MYLDKGIIVLENPKPKAEAAMPIASTSSYQISICQTQIPHWPRWTTLTRHSIC